MSVSTRFIRLGTVVTPVHAENRALSQDRPPVCGQTALVRNARTADGDTGVVRSVTLDQALAGAKAGKVYVLKACA